MEDVTNSSDATLPELKEEFRTWAEETNKTSRRVRVLLTSVFGPYAQDDEFGSRKINPMELLHNQVTRAQGVFSIRKFHNSWGLRMIQENISAPSAVLDFPTLEAFEKELTSHHYDIVGISSIIMNVGKVKEMCRTARRLSPDSKIVVGGHVAAIPGLEKEVDADHIVKGEGISWMRRYLGENADAPIKHPVLYASFDTRTMGVPIADAILAPTATVIPSVGCPMACNFCTTSAFFGGKGKFVNLLKTGQDIYNVMNEAESTLKAEDFFVMDENFLLDRKRAMELLGLMKANNKSWSMYVFSSANAIKQYTMEELAQIGVSWVWLGLESRDSKYAKLKSADTMKLVRELQSHGIKVFGSTIIGLPHHTPENMNDEIEHAVAHKTDFHQFALYTPVPGTPLYSEMEADGLLLKDTDLADIHGQYKFNFKHPHISRDDSKKFLDQAFQRDFERNGPSTYRLARTLLKGWRRYKNHPDQRVHKRFSLDAKPLKIGYPSVLWAMEQMYEEKDKSMAAQIRTLRLEIEKEFGFPAKLAARVFGFLPLLSARMEENRLARGQTYEPPTSITRKNWQGISLAQSMEELMGYANIAVNGKMTWDIQAHKDKFCQRALGDGLGQEEKNFIE